jgi:hypothetical protein
MMKRPENDVGRVNASWPAAACLRMKGMAFMPAR